jgi:hypothetical protein
MSLIQIIQIVYQMWYKDEGWASKVPVGTFSN